MNQRHDLDALRIKLQELKVEHRDLDSALHQIPGNPPGDQLMLQRIKKRKLQIKDRISQIEGMLEPDIPA
jgi:hypothetical protein